MKGSRQSDTSRQIWPAQLQRALAYRLTAFGPDCLDTSLAARRRFFMSRIKDIASQRFGRFVVMHMDGFNKRGHAVWLCLCDCGVSKRVQGRHLRDGSTQSCGCLNREKAAQRRREGTGDRNGMWKGVAASYFAKHMRVNAIRGRPQRCEQCGTTDPTKTYEWASMTGNYDDVNDYRRMCRSCHRKYDGIKPSPRTR